MLPPFSEPTTSKDAAESMIGISATIRNSIFQHLIQSGSFGATSDELQVFFNLRGDTIRPRLWELEHDKKIYKSEMRRITRSGRIARVYLVNKDCEHYSTCQTSDTGKD